MDKLRQEQDEKALLRHKHALAQIRLEKVCCPYVYICTVCLCTYKRILVVTYVCMYMCVCAMHPHLHVANDDVGTVHTYVRTYVRKYAH